MRRFGWSCRAIDAAESARPQCHSENQFALGDAPDRARLEAGHLAVTSVIAGVSNVAQVEANAAGGGWELTEAEKAEVDALATTGLEEPVEPPAR